jgi:hypothetical protein
MVNVLFLGVVKNVESVIKTNINKVFFFMNMFEKSKLVIYENNSTDNTKNILKGFSEDERLECIMEDFTDKQIKDNSEIWAYTKVTGLDHSCRIEQISNARNKVVDEINKSKYDEYDVVVWIDMDLLDFHFENLESFVEEVKNDEKLVLTGNSPRYYDYYALRINQEIHNGYTNRILGPEIVGDKFWHYISRDEIFVTQRQLVASAFNGVGIYHKNVFKNHKYNCIVDEYVEKYYLLLLKNNTSLKKYVRVISSPCPRFPGGKEDKINKIMWKNNFGYDKPVVCEHVALHASLNLEDYKIFIEPKLMVRR